MNTNKIKHSILLIEDDLSVNGHYDSSLKDKIVKLIPHSFVSKFPSGQLALSGFQNVINQQKRQFDFLIADLKLIDMAAEELLEKVYAMGIKIKVILIAEDELRCIQARNSFKAGEKILSKPLHMSDFIALIEGVWETFQYDDEDKGDMVPVRLAYLQDEHAYPFDLFISLNAEKRIKIFHGEDFVDNKRLDKLALKGVRFLYAKKSDVLTIKHKMYLPIRSSTLIPQEIIPFNVYVDDFSPLYKNGYMVNTSDISRLRNMKITQLFIEDRDELRYQKYLDKKFHKFIADNQIELQEKTEVLSNYLNQRVQSIITNPTKENLEPLIIAQKHFQSFVKGEKDSLRAIIGVLKSDNQNIYNHSIAVATLSYAITLEVVKMREDPENHKKVRAMDELDLESEESINILFIGGLLHDIGKAIMYFNAWAEEMKRSGTTGITGATTGTTSNTGTDDDSVIIPEQYLKMHPQLGYETLKQVRGINQHILEIVLQHEEYCDGTGYPKGLSRNFITNYAQLITIANYYDNIMRLSSTLKTINKERAIANMEQNSPKFNKAFLHAFKTLLLRVNL
ncbi:MAG: HD domain-containing protein [Oligoflexia bacterium]|nr:HD domain-containing protein [Oligoflexia bacterium]